MKNYDIVFITHLPAFYKINLYNFISERKNIFVIFISDGSSIRNSDFNSHNMKFESLYLNKGPFETRNKILSCVRLLRFMRCVNAEKIVVGGWDLPEFWLSVIYNSKNKNAVVIESTIYESSTDNLVGLVKKFFLKMVSLAYCSGRPHEQLLRCLGYTGRVLITRGVGLKNKSMNCNHDLTERSFPLVGARFLYVGRLSQEKGLLFLFDFFRGKNEISLTVVGDGPLKEILLKNCPENVNLIGYVSNIELGQVYSSHDIFILPSHSEAWGLVIEEALYYNLPIICSSSVGCNIDLVIEPDTGIVFDDGSSESLCSATKKIIENYSHYVEKVKLFNSKSNDEYQVNIYMQ